MITIRCIGLPSRCFYLNITPLVTGDFPSGFWSKGSCGVYIVRGTPVLFDLVNHRGLIGLLWKDDSFDLNTGHRQPSLSTLPKPESLHVSNTHIGPPCVLTPLNLWWPSSPADSSWVELRIGINPGLTSPIEPFFGRVLR